MVRFDCEQVREVEKEDSPVQHRHQTVREELLRAEERAKEASQLRSRLRALEAKTLYSRITELSSTVQHESQPSTSLSLDLLEDDGVGESRDDGDSPLLREELRAVGGGESSSSSERRSGDLGGDSFSAEEKKGKRREERRVSLMRDEQSEEEEETTRRTWLPTAKDEEG